MRNMEYYIKKLKDFIFDEDYRFLVLKSHGLYNKMNDEEYIKRLYKTLMHKELNLDNPQTYNEKIQWLKLFDHQPEYQDMVDKYEAKRIVEAKIGAKYVIPTLGIWNSVDDIDFDRLPNQFVLKSTHDSHGIVICRDKSKLDIQKAKRKLRRSLKNNYYYFGREWPYKDLKHRIIAEEYKTDYPGSDDLTDYKFYCFHGVADCVLVCLDRGSGDTKFYFFDKEWNLKRHNKRGKLAPEGFTIPKPECMDEMFSIAEILSADIPSVRVDLYQSCGQVYFGEYTFYPASGFDPNRLPEADYYFGSLIDLSKIKRQR